LSGAAGTIDLVAADEAHAVAYRGVARDRQRAGDRAADPTGRGLPLYRARASLCELLNAHVRSIDQFLVRGLAKVTSVVLLGAIATNLLQHAATLLTQARQKFLLTSVYHQMGARGSFRARRAWRASGSPGGEDQRGAAVRKTAQELAGAFPESS